ncbi:alpha/beta hydrolase [Candidatus Endowatersipora endosymbiont of Watersipora subatra]|uniref:alpha/beta hydrolase n=1 Tax=Candidatus Endowatersipora endosymbiont of Watersipora subatra TaxID=3077946 RepID=UPI00312C7432
MKEMNHRFRFSDTNPAVVLAVKTQQNADSNGPGFIWFGGFRSDMMGKKAESMVAHAAQLSCTTVRFDYSGHGQSSGNIVDGTISSWIAQALSVFRKFTRGPQVVLGSSMGAWIALRVAQELERIRESERLSGMLLIAPASDFTQYLMKPRLINDSNDSHVMRQLFFDDGDKNLVMDDELVVNAPIHILQGMKDSEVPYSHTMRLFSCLSQDNVTLTLIKDGDHRLSTDENIKLLKRTMTEFLR